MTARRWRIVFVGCASVALGVFGCAGLLALDDVRYAADAGAGRHTIEADVVDAARSKAAMPTSRLAAGSRSRASAIHVRTSTVDAAFVWVFQTTASRLAPSASTARTVSLNATTRAIV
jgi:hypothetical protein